MDSVCLNEEGCLFDKFYITVFQNGDSKNGVTFEFSPIECLNSSSIADYIGSKVGCDDGCKIYDSKSRRIYDCFEMKPKDVVYTVAKDRVFMWPTFDIGHKIVLDHISASTGKPIVLEVLSESPRLFQIHNFFSSDEADMLINDALSMKGDDFRLKRSSTGANGYTINKIRTSENAFVSETPVAITIKKRCFQVLGIEQYDETWADGLQVLRYNISTAYIAHMDYLGPGENDFHDYDSANKGTNRFATVLLYLSDVEVGGETVFVNGQASNFKFLEENIFANNTNEYWQKASNLFHPNSWESHLVQQCKTRLSVKPMKTRAVLFYSQHPDGREDLFSQHGACPVIEGTKWAANLWVWNGPRFGSNEPLVTNVVNAEEAVPIYAEFHNLDCHNAELYWENTKWGDINIGEIIAVNTFVNHNWHVKIDGNIVRTFVVQPNSSSQIFQLSKDQLNFNIDQ